MLSKITAIPCMMTIVTELNMKNNMAQIITTVMGIIMMLRLSQPLNRYSPKRLLRQ